VITAKPKDQDPAAAVLKAHILAMGKPCNRHSEKRAELARRLLDNSDMHRVWRELHKHGVNPLAFLTWVHQSFDYAAFEAVRQSPTETGDQLKKIERLLTNLKTEIEQSPFPRNQATALMDIDHPSLPSVQVSMGWHGMNPKHDWIGYPISVQEVLSVALGMLAKHREREPLRLVARQRGRGENVEIVSFVRHMAWLCKRYTGKALACSLAHVTNAIYDPENPLDKVAASDMIKKSPAALHPKPNKKGGA
jgi:hypothetical protein